MTKLSINLDCNTFFRDLHLYKQQENLVICFSTFIKTRTLHRGETSQKLEPKKLTFLSRRRKLNAILPRFGGHKKFDLN